MLEIVVEIIRLHSLSPFWVQPIFQTVDIDQMINLCHIVVFDSAVDIIQYSKQ